ncbi:sensor histidine kinase [Nonomuraea diastatica]|uniref:histidine kinase n=1 Tax=Nonomuraea diastatica TaxID=1848329 RepID=A0A4R4X3A8_9ACTN|nr:ATP-binding protein [Nonomuraea diastatica]TDD24734.1 HAMP domain-containing protein [Nonomuraea diastatica]
MRLPARTMRLRLTLLYSSVFAGSGIILLGITYLLVSHAAGIFHVTGDFGGSQSADISFSGKPSLPELAQVRALVDRHRDAILHELLVQSGIALAIMMVVSVALGWLVAGRALRPMGAMAVTVREISAGNLHERLAVQTPHDELKDLADTVDELLARLESAFDAQKHFVANAAHELRTPLTLERALLEEALTDGEATRASFRVLADRLLRLSIDQDRRLEALLTLANSERGPDRQEPFDLAAVVERVLDAAPSRIGAALAAAPVSGDPAQVERLIANLVDNAVQHNVPGGRANVVTGVQDGRALLSVSNSGPVIPPGEIERLFAPFQRLRTERTTHDDGHHGLGLSIVQAVATAHNAVITAHAAPSGGLLVEIAFPLRR